MARNIRRHRATLAEMGQPIQEPSAKERASMREEAYLDLIDRKDSIEKYQDHLRKMSEGTLEVPGFFRAVAADAAMEIVHISQAGESEKIRLDASKDILDRAGYGKTQKVEVAGRVDHNTSKMELINIILTSARKVGLKKEVKEVGEPPPLDLKVDDRGTLVVPDRVNKGESED